MNTVDDLRAALNYPSSPPTPDAAAIIARGRRRRTARRASFAGGLAAAAAIAVGVATVAPGTDTLPTPPSAGGLQDIGGGVPDPVLVAANRSLASAAPSPGGPAVAPTRFDPLMRTLHVGWIPPGIVDQQADTGIWGQSYGGRDRTYTNGGEPPHLDAGLAVTVLAKGRPVTELPEHGLGLPPVGVTLRPTEPVHGRPAECLGDPAVPGSCSGIRWQYAPGAWAQVSYSGSAGRTPAQATVVARRVAESVSLSAAEPVRLPFRLEGRLATLRTGATSVSLHPERPGDFGERWDASIYLVDDEKEMAKPHLERRVVAVGAMQKYKDPSGRIPRDPRPNTRADGHPAHLLPGGGSLVVWGVNRSRVFVEFTNHPGDARAAYDDLRLLPEPDDPADWVPARR